MFCHTQIQRLSKTSGTGDQGYGIIVFPPFFDKHGLINIEIPVILAVLKVLYDNDMLDAIDELAK